ncbi:HD-GYP domain-containing protein [Salisediminibacterium selenitireducens]|uniref:Metal dependent phosphohydrolase n=1 Tax=Bacillus selenitireducens (strain ATCC 700615 / DSM 15326 / MLS10) TaxID=439292 RepID=D6Y173_BACIE|nr:HD-GYP domain-containing protein [Salisediminibacterium selenitireducens]ADH98677.1 metal dependent phosphohydrolase [[Bacillus] selenitireducens MLS10]
MKLKSINAVKKNDVLAKPIYNDEGQVLLNASVKLSESMISRLQDKGVSFVYLEDPDTDDIFVNDTLPPEKKAKAVKTINKSFKTIAYRISEGKNLDIDDLTVDFASVVEEILNTVTTEKDAITMLSNVMNYDSYVYQHSLSVTVYAIALGKKKGLNMKQLKELGLGAMLHDVGKMGIPIEVLNKKQKLTDEEFDTIKQHAELGFDMLRKSKTLPLLAAHCAYQHHERLDGSGYPRKIGEKDIHLYGQILAVADVFDAVTSHRVYRSAMLPHEGLELLQAGSGTLFNRELVDLFAKTVAIYPVGLEVVLSDGSAGVVKMNNPLIPDRPVIKVLRDAHGQRFDEPYELDLTERLNITIVKCEALIESKTYES